MKKIFLWLFLIALVAGVAALIVDTFQGGALYVRHVMKHDDRPIPSYIVLQYNEHKGTYRAVYKEPGSYSMYHYLSWDFLPYHPTFTRYSWGLYSIELKDSLLLKWAIREALRNDSIDYVENLYK